MKWFYQLSHKKRVWLTVGAWVLTLLPAAIADPATNPIAAFAVTAFFALAIFLTVKTVSISKKEKKDAEYLNLDAKLSVREMKKEIRQVNKKIRFLKAKLEEMKERGVFEEYESVLTEEQKIQKQDEHTLQNLQKTSPNSEGDDEEIQLMLKACIIKSRLASQEEGETQDERIAEYKKFIETYNALQMAEGKPENTISVDD